MVFVAGPILEYARTPSQRSARLVLGCLAAFAVAAVIAIGAGKLVEELNLRREAASLARANEPQHLWKSVDDVVLLPDGTLEMPNGMMARLAEMKSRVKPRVRMLEDSVPPPPPPDPTVEMSAALARFRTERAGCTVVGTAPDGLPIVQVWALSRRACYGMCGLSSRLERRRGNMRVWRNVGVHLAERGAIEGTEAAWTTPISVVGF